jgi:hypothetical protein
MLLCLLTSSSLKIKAAPEAAPLVRNSLRSE